MLKPKRKAISYNKFLLLIIEILFCAFFQIKAQTSNDIFTAQKDTSFYYNKTVYEIKGLFYNVKNNKLLSDTTFYENYPVDSFRLNVLNYPPGKIHIRTIYLNGQIYLYSKKEIIDFSKFDTVGFYRDKYTPYSVNLNNEIYFMASGNNTDTNTNRDRIEIFYYPNNRLKEINMSYGRIGAIKRYYPNGNLAREESYVDNQINGVSFSYYRNGLKKSEEKYYLGQLIYRKRWQLEKKRYFLSMYEQATPFLLLDSLHIEYKKKSSDSIYYNRKIWSSTVIHNNCGCIYLSCNYYDEYGNVIGKIKYNQGVRVAHIEYYTDTIPYIGNICKTAEIFNNDKKKTDLISNTFYYNKQGNLIAKDINYTDKSGKKNVRFIYPKKGKAIKQVYDETTSKYLPVK